MAFEKYFHTYFEIRKSEPLEPCVEPPNRFITIFHRSKCNLIVQSFVRKTRGINLRNISGQ